MTVTPDVAIALKAARELTMGEVGNKLPIDIYSLARSVGVERFEGRLAGPEGSLGRGSDGALVIRYLRYSGRSSVRTWRRRTRFTIAHEIGHLLLNRARDAVVGEAARGVMEGCARRTREEYAADLLAAELLMPERLVRAELMKNEPSWRVVYRLTERFETSTTAVMMRFLEVRDVLAVWLRVGFGEETPVRCDVSRKMGIRFLRPPVDEATTFLKESARTNKHLLRIDAAAVVHDVPCEGRVVEDKGKREYWIVGWMDRQAPPCRRGPGHC